MTSSGTQIPIAISGRQRPRWGSGPHVPENLTEGLYPIWVVPCVATRHKIPQAKWQELVEKLNTRSLRRVAREYGISHEAMRRMLAPTG